MATVLWVLSRTRHRVYGPGETILDEYTGLPVLDDDGNPKVATVRSDRIDAAATYAGGIPYGRTQCRANKGGWALCQLRVDDPAHVQGIIDDPDVFPIFEDDTETAWDDNWQGASLISPNGRGWNPGKFNRVIRWMEDNLGADTTGLTRDSTIEEILRRVVQAIEPEANA